MELATIHPQVVHFTVALLFVGVIARVLSLLPLGPRFSFLSPSAAVLIILGSIAAVLAALSGTAAHGPVERIPGVRPAVVEHEEAGEWTRDIFIAVGLLEIAGLAIRHRKVRQGMQVTAGVVGVVGLTMLYETAEHGGKLVYSYAGGVGTRSGDTADVQRLLIAGLYNQAIKDRDAGRAPDAARLMEELARRAGPDAAVRLLVADSRLRDSKDGKGALAVLDSIEVPPDSTRLAVRVGSARVGVFKAMGQLDSARAVLERLVRLQPANAGLKARLDSLQH